MTKNHWLVLLLLLQECEAVTDHSYWSHLIGENPALQLDSPPPMADSRGPLYNEP